VEAVDLIQAGVRTANGRIYPRHVMKKAIEECRDAVWGRRVLLHQPSDNWQPSFADAIGVITKAEFDGSRFKVEYELFPGKPQPESIHPIMEGILSDYGVVEEAKIIYFEAKMPEKEESC